MEITQPDADSCSTWCVANRLIVTEPMTGQLQLGDTMFESYALPQVNVASNSDDKLGLTSGVQISDDDQGVLTGTIEPFVEKSSSASVKLQPPAG